MTEENVTPFTPHNAGNVADPDDSLEAARRDCPVSQVSDVLFVVTSDKDVRAMFKDSAAFSNRGNFTIGREDRNHAFPGITNLDPPVHTELRSRLLRSMAPKKLRSLGPHVARVIARALDALPPSGEVELHKDYISHIPSAVTYSMIGLPEEYWSEVEVLADALVEAVPAPETSMPEYDRLMELMGQVVRDRRKHPEHRRDDILDNLCFATPGEREMEDLEVIMHLRQLFAAATDTTRALIANCIYRLLEHGDWARIVADRSLLKNAIEESLRFDSPAQFMTRSVVRDTVIGECPVTVGHKAYLSIQSANHDEASWGPTARRFDITRQVAVQHVAFGRGIHSCLGAPLARMETYMAIDALMNHYPRMTAGRRATWEKCEGLLLRRPKEVWVQLVQEMPVTGTNTGKTAE
ncbi:cytochrome P450 [Streptomyces prunicolor]|uniref:cytochrome P450 n=1 Tax=Streptomyces prunicolor TaxID=67348 RepID=UPI00386EB50E|nr:cytochrome P450 [Streptomyces prunicolor]